MAYLDGHAALIVFGGTIAVAAISYQLDHIWMMIGSLPTSFGWTQSQLCYHNSRVGWLVAEWYRTDVPDIKREVKTIKDHFLRDYMALLVEATMTTEELERILRKENSVHLSPVYGRCEKI